MLFLLSLAGSIIGIYAAPPTDIATLKVFIEPSGPGDGGNRSIEQVIKEDPAFAGNRNFRQ